MGNLLKHQMRMYLHVILVMCQRQEGLQRRATNVSHAGIPLNSIRLNSPPATKIATVPELI